MREIYTDGSSGTLFTYPIVGIYRHDRVMCDDMRRYSVVICVEQISAGERCFDAVMDDFGNLVRVQ